jgi:glycosyltransferase involved in cell wall biosynthesis
LLPLFTAEQANAFRRVPSPRKIAVLTRARTRLARELRELPTGSDTVIVQRQVDLAPLLTLERSATADRRVIYDVDDAIWLSGRQTAGHPLGVLKGTARKVRWLTGRADEVIAGSEILAEHLGRYSSRVTVVPSMVDTDSYVVRRHEQGAAVTLGWIGSPTTVGYLHAIGPVLERFARESRRPVELEVVGGEAPRLDGIEILERAWSPEVEQLVLGRMDIGLMPLDDTPWSRGKCAYKALQYLAAGVPAVVADVGISARVATGAGWVAGSQAQWLEGLHLLADDPDLRQRLGAVGRQRIERDFSPARWVPTLGKILKGEALSIEDNLPWC